MTAPSVPATRVTPMVARPPCSPTVMAACSNISAPAVPSAPAKVELPSSDANYLNNPPPPYPPLSKRMGEQGRVVVRALVGREGHVERTVVVESVADLDAAAVAVVRQSRWKPALKDKKPVAVWVNCPVTFRLRGAED